MSFGSELQADIAEVIAEFKVTITYTQRSGAHNTATGMSNATTNPIVTEGAYMGVKAFEVQGKEDQLGKFIIDPAELGVTPDAGDFITVSGKDWEIVTYNILQANDATETGLIDIAYVIGARL